MSRNRLLFAGAFALVAVACLAFVRPAKIPAAGASFLKGAEVDPEVRAILDRSCADCHSDDTRYPWYSYVPVVSRIIKADVARGREQLNLSKWSEYSRLRQQRALTGIANQVRDRMMPLPNYLRLHPSARLTDKETDEVFQWAQRERLRLILESRRSEQ